MSSKTCYRCKQILPQSEFAADASKKDGHGSSCRACANERQRERYRTDAAYAERARQNKREQRTRARLRLSSGRKKNPDREDIALRWRVARARLGLTLGVAATRIGIHTLTLKRIEQGKSLPAFTTIWRAVTLYKTTGGYLTGHDR